VSARRAGLLSSAKASVFLLARRPLDKLGWAMHEVADRVWVEVLHAFACDFRESQDEQYSIPPLWKVVWNDARKSGCPALEIHTVETEKKAGERVAFVRMRFAMSS
jgi:hypothetical protein